MVGTQPIGRPLISPPFFFLINVACFFQVFIRGSHIIVSRLSIDVDVQILTNPSLNSGQSSKARYQVTIVNNANVGVCQGHI